MTTYINQQWLLDKAPKGMLKMNVGINEHDTGA